MLAQEKTTQLGEEPGSPINRSPYGVNSIIYIVNRDAVKIHSFQRIVKSTIYFRATNSN